MKISKEYIYVVIAGMVGGFVVFFGQIFANNGFSLFEMSILPYVGSLVFLLPIVIWYKQRWTRKNIGPILLRGFFAALLVLSQFGGILFAIPVAVIVLLIYTQPLWTILFGRLFLHERIHRFHIVAGFLVMGGVFLIAYPRGGNISLSIPGVIVGLIAGISLSLWLIAGAQTSKKGINPYLAKFSEIFFSLIFIGLLYPVFKLFFHDPAVIGFGLHWPWKIWLACILYALITQVIAHVLYLKGAKKVSAVSIGIIFLLEPVVAAILSVLFLHQILTLYIIIGGILILLGNILVMIYTHKEK